MNSWPPSLNELSAADMVVNFLVYLPVGFLGLLTMQRSPRLVRWLGPILLGVIFSTAMELTQASLPSRVVSLVDVLSDTLGAAAGVFAGVLWAGGFGRLFPSLAQRLSSDSGGVLLLAFWVGAQWMPFLPSLQPHPFRAKVLQLLHFQWMTAGWDLLTATASSLAAIAILGRLWPDSVAACCWVPLLVLAVRFFLAQQQPLLGDVAGVLIAPLLWMRLEGGRHRYRFTVWALLAAIVLGGLSPFRFLATPQSFSWMPFGASLHMSSWHLALIILLGKSFRFGAAIWLLRQCRIGFLPGGVLVAALAAAIEWIQIYLPGRTAEITDPVLCLLLAAALRLLELVPAASGSK